MVDASSAWGGVELVDAAQPAHAVGHAGGSKSLSIVVEHVRSAKVNEASDGPVGEDLASLVAHDW